MALGLPGLDKWFKLHKTDPRPLLRQAGIYV
jgi:hypothetical protein